MKKSFFLAAALACILSACESKLVEQVQLIPQAEKVEIQNGSFALTNLQTIQAPEAWKASAENDKQRWMQCPPSTSHETTAEEI
jgi:hypothetical protein